MQRVDNARVLEKGRTQDKIRGEPSKGSRVGRGERVEKWNHCGDEKANGGIGYRVTGLYGAD